MYSDIYRREEIALKLHYMSKRDEKVFQNERLILREYNKLADKIMNRLSELRAAESLEDIPNVPPPRRHKLTGNYQNCWGVDVSKNQRIVIEPYGDFDIMDLKTIKEVKIVKIEDYH